MMRPADQVADTASSKPRREQYPTRDNQPIGETDWHVMCVADALICFHSLFAGRTDVYYAGANFLFYEEGNPKARVTPDAYVVKPVA